MHFVHLLRTSHSRISRISHAYPLAVGPLVATIKGGRAGFAPFLGLPGLPSVVPETAIAVRSAVRYRVRDNNGPKVVVLSSVTAVSIWLRDGGEVPVSQSSCLLLLLLLLWPITRFIYFRWRGKKKEERERERGKWGVQRREERL